MTLLAQSVPSFTVDEAGLPLWVHLVRVLVLVGFLLPATALLIWAERRTLARMQARIGPNRAGPAGLLQSLADGVKLFFKEDVRPDMVDAPVFYLAPLIAPVTGLLAAAIVPFGRPVTLFGETFQLQVFDPDIGVLWFLAMGSIHVYGIVLAGWSSGSAYPLLGGVRSAAQMISYELPLGLAVAAVFVYSGTLRVSEIVGQQTGPGLVAGIPNWYVIPLFPAFILFLTALIAETSRHPFDLPEAEGELVGGFHTEYTGIKFAMFFLGEFMNVIVGSALIVTLFFGGPSGPVLTETAAGLWPVLWFLVKLAVFVFVFVWLRATLPRFRYDRLMDVGWRFMLPLGLVWVLATAFMVMVNTELEARQRTTVAVAGVAAAVLLYVLAPLFSRGARRTVRRPMDDRRAFDEPEEIHSRERVP
ncbi:MAG: NADH-quinone oxidoreductase subunit NuoH [Actinobacteria bacterium]|nr:NADH-quinone oxidoreductase subunit NuoH [Actinomycetota bacterium]